MKVLHVITGLKKGGAETLLCNLCHFDNEPTQKKFTK